MRSSSEIRFACAVISPFGVTDTGSKVEPIGQVPVKKFGVLEGVAVP